MAAVRLERAGLLRSKYSALVLLESVKCARVATCLMLEHARQRQPWGPDRRPKPSVPSETAAADLALR